MPRACVNAALTDPIALAEDVRGTWLFFDPPAGEDSGDVAADNAAYERVDQRALGLRVREGPDHMNPASADHADDIKREGAGAASEIVVVYRLGLSCLRHLLPLGAHSAVRWDPTPRQCARAEHGDGRDHTGWP